MLTLIATSKPEKIAEPGLRPGVNMSWELLTESFNTKCPELLVHKWNSAASSTTDGNAGSRPQQKTPTFQHFCSHFDEEQMQKNCKGNVSAVSPSVSTGFSFNSTVTASSHTFDTNQ